MIYATSAPSRRIPKDTPTPIPAFAPVPNPSDALGASDDTVAPEEVELARSVAMLWVDVCVVGVATSVTMLDVDVCVLKLVCVDVT
jgi:hypothetical protein